MEERPVRMRSFPLYIREKIPPHLSRPGNANHGRVCNRSSREERQFTIHPRCCPIAGLPCSERAGAQSRERNFWQWQ